MRPDLASALSGSPRPWALAWSSVPRHRRSTPQRRHGDAQDAHALRPGEDPIAAHEGGRMTPSEKTDQQSNCERMGSSQSRRRRAPTHQRGFALAERWGVPPRRGLREASDVLCDLCGGSEGRRRRGADVSECRVGACEPAGAASLSEHVDKIGDIKETRVARRQPTDRGRDPAADRDVDCCRSLLHSCHHQHDRSPARRRGRSGWSLWGNSPRQRCSIMARLSLSGDCESGQTSLWRSCCICSKSPASCKPPFTVATADNRAQYSIETMEARTRDE